MISGLFLWVFDGNFNIPNSGFADLAPFFQLGPWILVVLIPAITMKSFSDEKKIGTLELLLTKPISKNAIVYGKYLGAFSLVIFSIIPTFIYVWAISSLGNPEGNLDWGVTIGSYLGLFLLGAVFTAIGVFASTLSDNQIVVFIISVFCCFVLYFGLDGLAGFIRYGSLDTVLAYLGIQSHYTSISRGVIDTRDIIYFLSIVLLFNYLTAYRLTKINASS